MQDTTVELTSFLEVIGKAVHAASRSMRPAFIVD